MIDEHSRVVRRHDQSSTGPPMATQPPKPSDIEDTLV
jgi:hypothetical protein